MIILGIDPGLEICGYAVIKSCHGREKLPEAGIFRTDKSLPLPDRLAQIAKDLQALLESFHPAVVAVEELYSHYKHPKTAILMGHARGVILHKATQSGAEVRSFAATRIKKALTGNGRAKKQQMQRAIQSTLGLKRIPKPPDVADAIAAGLCCANELNRPEM